MKLGQHCNFLELSSYSVSELVRNKETPLEENNERQFSIRYEYSPG